MPATFRSLDCLLDEPSACKSDFRLPVNEDAAAGGEPWPSGELMLVVCVGMVGAVDVGGITAVDEDDDGIEI